MLIDSNDTWVDASGNTKIAGADQGQSLLIMAPLLASGQAFSNWTGDITTPAPDATDPICVAGRNPARHIQVNYVARQPTALSVAAASGIYGGTVDLNATLTAGGAGVSGKTISFSLNGVTAGTATTNASGVATLTGVSLAGIAAGTYAAGPASGVAASFTTDATHTGSSGGSVLTVGKADQVIEWATPANIVYGTALGAAQLNAAVTVGDGALTFTPAAGTVLNAGTHALQVDAAETANYKPASKTVSLVVEKADQVIEWATPSNIVYGTALGAAQLNAVVTVGDGALTYTLAAGTVLNAGTHTLQVDAAETGNYKPASKTVTLVVEKADQVIAWAAPANIVYGTALSNAQLNAVVAVGDGALTYTPAAGTVLDAGTHALQVDAAETANYKPATKTVSLVVDRKPATIILNDRAKVYGDTVTFAGTEFTTSGFISGNQVTSISIASAGAVATAAVGQFDITGGSATGYGLSNYIIAYEDGVLSVTTRPLTVTADNKSKILGAADPALTYQISDGNMVNGDQLAGSPVRAAGESVGIYPIGQGTVSAGSNYALTFVPGIFKIEYAPATVPCLGGYGKTILQPINANGLSVFKQGATVPAKFRVCDASGNSVGTPGVVTAFRLVQVKNGTVTLVNEEVVSTAADTAFRWSADGAQWIFNINTKNLQASQTYVYEVSLNDGNSFTFQFGLK
jgi:ribosomal protein L18E